MRRAADGILQAETHDGQEVTEYPNKDGNCRNRGIALVITLLCWMSFVVAARMMYCPPLPIPANGPASQFSAMRADQHLRVLVADDRPHPAGSEQNRVVRNRLIALLQSFGYEVNTQQTQSILEYRRTENDPDTVPIVNVLARLPGTTDLGAVMLVAHYDSVPFGPGASDDGVGVAAILEIARMMRQSSSNKRDIIFLITDGEEYGLLGAKRFVAEHPWAAHAEFVVNVEARGTSGPSLMFQTSDDSNFLIRIFSQSATRPMASSLFYEIYRHMPNDTDFTIFREHGIRGFNLAFIGDVQNYHTEYDRFENVDRGSLQHHGENTLALAVALGNLPETEPDSSRTVYFDVMGRWILFWPEQYSMMISIAAMILIVIAFVLSIPCSRSQLTSMLTTSGLVVVYIAAVVAAGWLIDFFLRLDGRLDFPWTPSPLPICLTFWFAMLAIICGMSAFWKLLQNPKLTWFAVWVPWTLFALITSVYFAGGSYLFIVPAVAACISLVISAVWIKSSIRLSAVIAAVITGLVWLPLEQLFYDAMGFKINLVMAIRAAIVGSTLLPVLATTEAKTRNRLPFIFFAATIAAFLAAVFLNPPGGV